MHTVDAKLPSKRITVVAPDGYPLAADLWLPPDGRAPHAAVVVGGALAVHRRFYGPFAAFLARSGLAALTFDYRGIGGSRGLGSLRGDRARLRDWGELDLTAAFAELARRAPGVPMHYVAHSVGGQVFGLVRDPPVVRAAFVASQSGHWRHWDGLARVGMFGVWHAVIPAFTLVTGRLPMSAVGRGEDVPPGVAREWATWGRDREYVLSYAKGLDGIAFHAWSGALRSYAISDDRSAPPRSIEALLPMYRAATKELVVWRPADAGVDVIGHFGPFVRRFEATLWAELRDWLVGGPARADR
ncbi:alpha/beta hydrolase [Myxococcota bacterium]|nr:alpha/beta hydrolase [Myxococcota bacterium]